MLKIMKTQLLRFVPTVRKVSLSNSVGYSFVFQKGLRRKKFQDIKNQKPSRLRLNSSSIYGRNFALNSRGISAHSSIERIRDSSCGISILLHICIEFDSLYPEISFFGGLFGRQMSNPPSSISSPSVPLGQILTAGSSYSFTSSKAFKTSDHIYLI